MTHGTRLTHSASQRIHGILVDQRLMLEEYFSLSITEDGHLESLPLIVPGYTPNLSKLPLCELSFPS